jgi:membrane dipeptidase
LIAESRLLSHQTLISVRSFPMEDARRLHLDAIVVDGHCDTLGDVVDGIRTLTERSGLGQIDLPRLREGGITAQVFACFVPVHEYRRGAARHAMKRLDALHQAVAARPDALLIAHGASDVRRAKDQGKIAAILGLEGAEALEESLAVLRCFHRLGVRNLGLTWNFRNAVADGVLADEGRRGLTPFGEQVIETCNDLGIVIDVSHLSPTGLSHVLAVSQQPVIASHSNAAALTDFLRNLSDAQIEAIAQRGGLIGVTFVPAFLTHPKRNASIQHVLDHIDHLLKVAGPDHVMIGSDFDGLGPMTPQGLEDVSRYPDLTAGMLARGHDETTIRRVLGLNFLRVFEQVTGH